MTEAIHGAIERRAPVSSPMAAPISNPYPV